MKFTDGNGARWAAAGRPRALLRAGGPWESHGTWGWTSSSTEVGSDLGKQGQKWCRKLAGRPRTGPGGLLTSKGICLKVGVAAKLAPWQRPESGEKLQEGGQVHLCKMDWNACRMEPGFVNWWEGSRGGCPGGLALL